MSTTIPTPPARATPGCRRPPFGSVIATRIPTSGGKRPAAHAHDPRHLPGLRLARRDRLARPAARLPARLRARLPPWARDAAGILGGTIVFGAFLLAILFGGAILGVMLGLDRPPTV